MVTHPQELKGDPNLHEFTMQDCSRIRKFLHDLTDPEMFGFAVTDEVRRRALDLLTMDVFK